MGWHSRSDWLPIGNSRCRRCTGGLRLPAKKSNPCIDPVELPGWGVLTGIFGKLFDGKTNRSNVYISVGRDLRPGTGLLHDGWAVVMENEFKGTLPPVPNYKRSSRWLTWKFQYTLPGYSWRKGLSCGHVSRYCHVHGPAKKGILLNYLFSRMNPIISGSCKPGNTFIKSSLNGWKMVKVMR